MKSNPVKHNAILALSKQAPVFFGEWGYPTDHNVKGELYGEGTFLYSFEEFVIPLMEFAEENNIGWTAWSWDDWRAPIMLKSRDSYEPTQYGQFVLRQLTKE